jgi:hypothetical protein
MSHMKVDNDQVVGAGIDLPRSRRPGSPMESALRDAAGAQGNPIARQTVGGEILRRADLQELTPVFGTAQPPRGLSGILRRYAYKIPDHKPRHWAVLFLADRVDVYESAVGEAFQRRPVATTAGVALLVGAAAALWLGAGRRRRSPWRRLLGA